MSLQINPIFEKQFDTGFDADAGVAVLNEIMALEQLAERLGIRSLEDFHAFVHVAIPNDFDGDPAEIYMGQSIRWHDPADGLKTVRALIDALERDASYLQSEPANDVIARLRSIEAALQKGIENKSRFSFECF